MLSLERGLGRFEESEKMREFRGVKTKDEVKTADLQPVIAKFEKLTRKNHLSYDQLKYVFTTVRKRLELDPPPKRRHPVELLTNVELENLVSTAYRKNVVKGLIVRTLLLSGARVNEFVNIKINDFNFEQNEIFIRDGKGHKARTVPILESLSRELQQYRGKRKAGWLFETHAATKFSVRRVQQVVKEVAKAAGITKRVYPHLLRHHIATYLINNKMPENHVQKFLGHAEPSSTQIYTQLAIEEVKRTYKESFTGWAEK